MGPRIPDPKRKRALAQQWVEGVSRHIIAKENQIGTGTVSRIIRGFKEDGFDLDLLREVGLN
jgi:transposase